MRILGIDLAAQPRNTGIVLLEPELEAELESAGNQPSDRRWRAVSPPEAATDEHLVDLGVAVDLIGVDAPLGWPIAFVDAVRAHEDRRPWPGTKDRRALTHRHTDDVVRDHGRGHPMSASADLLGHVAMRCALLQRDWAGKWGEAANRDGSGRLGEVYPASALRAWRLPERGYKGRSAEAGRARATIFDGLRGGTSRWLDAAPIRSACIDSDHILDAFVSALAALAAHRGLTHRPSTVEDHHCAVLEGWIHVPSVPLSGVSPTG